MTGLRERLRAIFTVEPVLLFFMTSTFILAPASQQLVIAKVCNEIYPNQTFCADPKHIKGDAEIQRRSSYIILAYAGMLSLVSIPPAMLLGSWSDKGGRKLGMVLPNLLSVASGCVFIAMATVESSSAYWCVAAAAAAGVSGGHVSVMLSCFSYVADVAEPESRTRRMALAESMIFVGGTAGFLLSGFLLDRSGFVATFAVCCAFNLAAVLYVLLWLPSPAREEARALLDEDDDGPAGEEDDVDAPAPSPAPSSRGPSLLAYAGRSFRAVLRKRLNGGRRKLLFLIICTFLNNLIVTGDQCVILLFLTYKPREFSTEMYGVFNSARMLLLGFSLMALFPLLLRWFGEMTLAKMAAFLRAASYVLLAFSTNTWMVFLAAAVGAPSGIPQAVTRSLSSGIVDPNEQGAMFSFMASMEALCILVSAVLFNGIYPLTLASFPGMVFIMMAALAFIILIFIQWISEMPATQPRLVIQD